MNVYKHEMLCFMPAPGVWWDHRGPHNHSWLCGPARLSERSLRNGRVQQPPQVGKLGVSLPLIKPVQSLRASMAKLGLTSIFPSESSSSPGADSLLEAAQCWSPAVETGTPLKSSRDTYMPASDIISLLFPAHAAANVIQLEKVMGREFFILKKQLAASYVLKVFSNPCAAPVLLVLLFWQVKGLTLGH